MPVYATLTDLGETTLTEHDADRYLRAASALVRAATRTALYRTTQDGAPLDPVVADAFCDATVEQVRTWVSLGLDPTTGPAAVGGGRASSSLLSGSATYAPRAGQDTDRVAALSTLAPLAADCLGPLLGQQPVTW